MDNEQPTECQRICYLIRSVKHTYIVLDSNFSCMFRIIDIASFLISRHWIQEFWMMFRLHHSLSDSLEQFRELIREQGQEHLCSLLETKWM